MLFCVLNSLGKTHEVGRRIGHSTSQVSSGFLFPLLGSAPDSLAFSLVTCSSLLLFHVFFSVLPWRLECTSIFFFSEAGNFTLISATESFTDSGLWAIKSQISVANSLTIIPVHRAGDHFCHNSYSE